MVMDGHLTWGDKYTIKCTDDVMQDCAPET